jgi:hypothetical protein
VAFQPRPCTVAEAQQVFLRVNPTLVVTGDRATLALP